MKIIVNAIPATAIATGIGRYLKELYAEIELQRPDLTIRYFDGWRLRRTLPSPAASGGWWTQAVKLAWKLPSLLPYAARVLARHNQARRFRELAQGFDVYHEAGYFPFAVDPPTRTVFTLHDVSLAVWPQYHPRDRVWFFRRFFKTALTHTDTLITPSAFTRNEFRRCFPESRLPVTVVPQGVSERFSPPPAGAIRAVRNKYNLPTPYLLFVGTADPRKNIKTLIQALTLLPEAIKLVLTGWDGWDKPIFRQKAAARLSRRIRFTGYVPESDLPALYAGARVLVYPSLYEGFGLPVLEAMACGCPVICAHAASLPEIGGPAVLYHSPASAAELARLIQAVYDSEALYATLRRQGLERCRQFGWNDTARQTLNVFQGVTA